MMPGSPRTMTQDAIMAVVVGVFIANMVSFAVIAAIWRMCRDGERTSPLALFAIALPMLLAAVILATSA